MSGVRLPSQPPAIIRALLMGCSFLFLSFKSRLAPALRCVGGIRHRKIQGRRHHTLLETGTRPLGYTQPKPVDYGSVLLLRAVRMARGRGVLSFGAVWVAHDFACCDCEQCGSIPAKRAVIVSSEGRFALSVLSLRAVWKRGPHSSQSQHAWHRVEHRFPKMCFAQQR